MSQTYRTEYRRLLEYIEQIVKRSKSPVVETPIMKSRKNQPRYDGG